MRWRANDRAPRIDATRAGQAPGRDVRRGQTEASKAAKRRWYLRNRDRILATRPRLPPRDKEKRCAYERRYRLRHPDKLRAKNKSYWERLRRERPEKVRELAKRYRSSEKAKAARRAWRKRNSSRLKEADRERRRANPERYRQYAQRAHAKRDRVAAVARAREWSKRHPAITATRAFLRKKGMTAVQMTPEMLKLAELKIALLDAINPQKRKR